MTSGIDRFAGINAFIQAAEAGSFSSAARRLGVSASAVGKAIARLESRLGVRLFHRSTRRITLTPDGRAFLERCTRIARELEDAERELATARGTPSGRLRVSLPMIGHLAMPVLSDFMRRHPAVSLDLDFNDHVVDVVGEGFDVVIRAGEVVDSRLATRPLGRFPYRIAASPVYLARRGRPGDAAALGAHACLRYRFPTAGRVEPWPLRDAELAARLPVTMSANSADALIELAELGHGIVCVPGFAMQDALDAGRLIALLDDALDGSTQFRLLWPRNPHLPPRLRAFIDHLAAHLSAP